MTTLELKGSLMNLIAKIEDENMLATCYYIISDLFINDEKEEKELLSPDQWKELDAAFLESDDERQMISHDEVKNKFSKWLK